MKNKHRMLSANWIAFGIAAIAHTAGCAGEIEDETTEPGSDTEAWYQPTSPGELTACDGRHYDMAQLTERLQLVEELRTELGIERVDNCEDAKRVVDAYHRLIESVPSLVTASAPVDSITLEDGTNRILGGYNVSGLPGMVQLAGCGGILINERAILTAAHCVADDIPGETNGWATKSISKFVTGAPDQVYNDTVRINIHPSYDGSATYDLAIIKLLPPATFPGFAASDRTRIYIDYGSELDHMWLYGRGPNETDGDGSGVLRYTSFMPDWWGPEHFLKDAGGDRVCKGDSGGPIVSWTPGGFQVVSGLIVNVSELSGKCAAAGAKQRAVRLHHKITWIEDMLDVDCQNFSDGGLDYVRCF
jgi:hypothetical protein